MVLSSSMSSYPFDEVLDHHQYHGYQISPVVDCTLSLGTPSTRQTADCEKPINRSSSKSNVCNWDLFQSSNYKRSSGSSSAMKGRGGNTTSTVLNNLNGDPLLARRCANCDTTSTPLWRNGPRGPKSLCNACGIRYKKEERRASNNGTANTNAGTTTMDHHHHHQYHFSSSSSSSSWAPPPPPPPPHHHMRVPSLGSEFRFMEDVDDHHGSSDASIPTFLSWRLNVSDNRHSGLVHDYT